MPRSSSGPKCFQALGPPLVSRAVLLNKSQEVCAPSSFCSRTLLSVPSNRTRPSLSHTLPRSLCACGVTPREYRQGRLVFEIYCLHSLSLGMRTRVLVWMRARVCS